MNGKRRGSFTESTLSEANVFRMTLTGVILSSAKNPIENEGWKVEGILHGVYTERSECVQDDVNGCHSELCEESHRKRMVESGKISLKLP